MIRPRVVLYFLLGEACSVPLVLEVLRVPIKHRAYGKASRRFSIIELWSNSYLPHLYLSMCVLCICVSCAYVCPAAAAAAAACLLRQLRLVH